MDIPEAPAMSDMAESAPTLPDATYSYRCDRSEYVAVPKSADAKGPYIKVMFTVTGPDSAEKFKGRKVFENLSVTGDGTFRLKQLLKATGHDDSFKLVNDQELVGLEFLGATTTEKGTGGYSDKNRIARYMALTSVPVNA